MSMPRSRQSHNNDNFSRTTFILHGNFCSILAAVVVVPVLVLAFHVGPTVAANHEALALLSWIHSSPSAPSFSSVFQNWNPEDPNPCNWTYITCSPQGFVTQIIIQSVELALPVPSNLSSFVHLEKLVISDANLTGTIPAEIGDCAKLSVLDLSFNGLVGSIPASIGKLQDLQDLVLNSNQLTGRIPSELGNCVSLKNLLLFDNRLGGNLPPELGKLSSLEVLRAGGNKDIVGEIPPTLGACSSLTVLGLADTKVSGPIPASLGRLRKLQTISIYTAMLSGEIPAEIGNCPELVNLYLYENALSGSLPPELGKLQKLEKMLLWQNSFVGAIPDEIGNCSSLMMIDLSLNSFSGIIPWSLGRLSELQGLMLSDNNISGSIPSVLSNCTNLIQMQLDTNQISGSIPPELGMLSKLTVFLAWENQLEGSIPPTLASCSSLQSIDLSHNSLSGSIPSGLFQLGNLTKLLLISNDISGPIPAEVGNCSSLIRLRLGDNRIGGAIPREIGGLKSLNFLDLSENRLTGLVPDEIGNCTELQMVNLSNNMLGGALPNSVSSLTELQVLDVSVNKFMGPIPSSFGRLASLNKLILSQNSYSGSIPPSLGLCLNLQLLDLSSNALSGGIPVELCRIEALDIALNLSRNELTGPIPAQISALSKLSILDLSHNKLGGELTPLSGLENLVSLNISYNNFTGLLPDNKLFRQLSATELAGNQGLCAFGRDSCFLSNVAGMQMENNSDLGRSRKLKLAIALLIAMTVAMVILGTLAVIRARRVIRDDDDSEMGVDSWPWQFTPFQKLNFSVEQVLKCLVDSNVIGKGCSGVVYRAELDNGEVIAVKKLWPTTMAAANDGDNDRYGIGGVRDSFSAEVKTLGSIRHKNIVRFLGCCWNRNTRLLMYDYMPNGSLGSLLHERSGSCLEWDLRYQIILGAAQGLAYLHHDCVPPIVHRDIKANNILIGLEFEPYIADFGLAKLVDDGDFARSSNTVAGSYGYIAPEYGYMMKITEKSDVYSYGVVVLEVLTGKQPIDPTIPEGLHVVDWVRQRRGRIEVLDPSLCNRPESEVEEMMQALGVALLCVNPCPDERPTMKDVAAMLKEIRHEREEHAKVDLLVKESPANDCRNSGGGLTSTPSSSMMTPHPLPQCNNTSFSASSLLYSSSSNVKTAFK
ncbi:PREDICTED: receptor-like protein kinase 2 [Nelumbo nucifera]|uniref:Receptor-like protein kinase 2 n=1 Tax=Nelumbo nucifera TaxID=4432 RepID=A0A1U7ZE35_NELNU|nr:PREDICTED: receptor-like protein kinase 2 [Nelumbo nucifera]